VIDDAGEIFNNKGVPIKSSAVTYDESVAGRLWKASAELAHLDPS
jgi:hypothetical protein